MKRHRPLLLEIVVALCLAFLIWLYAHSRAQTGLDNVVVPIALQLDAAQQENYELELSGPRRVTVSFSGSGSRIRELRRLLQRGSVKAVVPCNVPPEREKESRFIEKLRVLPEFIAVPPGLSLVVAEENAIVPVTFHRIVERELPVRLDVAGDVRVRTVQLEPAVVTVRGPKAILERARTLPTQPLAFTLTGDENEEKASVGQVALVTELEGRPVQARPEKVSYNCRVQPRQRVYEMNDVPVEFLLPAGFPYRPRFASEHVGRISVKFLGPPVDELPAVLAYIDLRGGNVGLGRNSSAVRIQLPKEFQLAPENVTRVPFVLEDPARGELERQ